MGDTESEIEATLQQFETDIENTKGALLTFLESKNIDSLAEKESGEKKAVPYVLSAYALSSLLFAYLRSEGEDINKVVPLLGQVKATLDNLSQPQKNSKKSSKPVEGKVSKEERKAKKSNQTAKHTIFDKEPESKASANKVKKSKKNKA
ncbi:hypothetical protein DASB73_003530 [Starmerella bacillaris]|uniref:Exosome complex protein n=1 Tax=Starmerella bacillaris TaxID=1247836 RepID=A0AAV5RDH9_STABA|nr:hypothetical protein DASB73_003530 [Starmerella bacillaris]